MKTQTPLAAEIPKQLLGAIRTFPLEREVEHCGSRWTVSPFDMYANCPRCSCRFKLRAYAASAAIEDLFDAVFEWLLQPGAADLATRRQEALREDDGGIAPASPSAKP
jgi:hypothetical protein